MDLAGDGQPDLVVMDGHQRSAGLFEHDDAEGWAPFRPFPSRLNRDLRDPNLRLVDVDGDGLADVLVTEDGGVTWHRSLGEDGFEAGVHVPGAHDEELGPRLVFADAERTVHVADLSGDGLSDLVQVRQGEVAYYPSLGFGRYGRRVTMDNSPTFDLPGRFDPRRLLLADIDGTGTTDLIYLHPDGVRLYFNQSGNGWSDAVELPVSPPIDEAVSVVAIDLLGNGTACLVWSSPLLGDAGRQMRYVDLMGAKPHLLVRTANNLGAETRISYAPSTRFYLEDRAAGRPWIRRLPFPVHVVERVETVDYIGRNRFVTRYAYHHGHYDGEEREFRGFGLVDQWDTERMAALTATGDPLTDDNIDAASHVPPVRTRTWFHTGAFTGRDHVARQYEDEYWREPGLAPDQARELLLDDTVLPDELTLDELPEAARALKGAMLRQEVYAEDAGPGATADQRRRAETPYTVTEQSHALRLVQPRGTNRHAVFLAHPAEEMSWSYERAPADPRVMHELTLEVDTAGNVLKRATASYGRRPRVRLGDGQGGWTIVPNPALATMLPADVVRQTRPLVTYIENRVTNDVNDDHDYRLGRLAEAVTYELTGYVLTGPGRLLPGDLVEPDPGAPGCLRLIPGDRVEYEELPSGAPCRRPIEHVRTLFRGNDLDALIPLGLMASLAIPGATFRLAFTEGFLAAVYERPTSPGQPQELLLQNAASLLGGQGGDEGGYTSGESMVARGLFPADDPVGSWWAGSATRFYSPDPAELPAGELAEARAHFFLPRRDRDAFGHDIVIDFDPDDLLPVQTRDELGNRTTVVRYDYRVLQPRLISDPNQNRTEAAFDALGMLAATASMGKPPPAPAEGDTLDGVVPDPDDDAVEALLSDADPVAAARDVLGESTTRFLYDWDRYRRSRLVNPSAPERWLPTATVTIAREVHVSDAGVGQPVRVQLSYVHSDGFGREIQRKAIAEPGPVAEGGPVTNPRYSTSSWIVFDNKGNAVRKYEPSFSATQAFEFGQRVGVSPILFYDPRGRVIVTLNPDHSFEKVRFGPWDRVTFDANDTSSARGTVTGDPRTDPDAAGFVAAYFTEVANGGGDWHPWHELRVGGAMGPREQTAASRAAAHADTPSTVHYDPLGRTFLTVVRNRVACPAHDQDGTEGPHATRVVLDIEGNQVEVRDSVQQAGDPLGRIVMRNAYNLLGERVFQRSADAGTRWILSDVLGQPIRAWDSRGHTMVTSYDGLRRAISQTVRGTTDASDQRVRDKDVIVDLIEYGEPAPGAPPAEEVRAASLNLRTRVRRHFDGAGVAVNGRVDANGDLIAAFDFKGNLIASTRYLLKDATALPDWSANPPLLAESFTATTRYDALNRPIQSVKPHSSLARATRTIIQTAFNNGGLLSHVDVWLERAAEPTGLLDPLVNPPSSVGIEQIHYDAKGRRHRIEYRNGASTTYTYDPLTFRLASVYTRRGAAYTEDAENATPPPATIAAPERPTPGRHAGLQNLSYTYDPVGNVTDIRDAAQQSVFFRNARVDPGSDFVYDALYRLIEATGREHLGQVNGIRNPPTAPDAGNRFHGGLDHPSDAGALGNYVEDYIYDAVGNIQAIRHRGSDPANPGWSRTFDYSELSEIEDGSAGSATKTNNRLTRTTTGSGGPNPVVEPYEHDAHGNITRLPHLGGGQPGPNLFWDFRDQPYQANLGGGGTAYYAYDASGERIRKVIRRAPGLTEERVYLGGFEAYRRHPGAIGEDTARFERETVHIKGGDGRAALVETRTLDPGGVDHAPRQLIRYQLGDHLGSTVLELDDLARIVSREEYSPYGSSTYQAVRSQQETPNRYRFTGKERDDETGLYYHGARYYAPWLGRWASCDPAGLVDGPCLYQYALGNPVRIRDPSGRQNEDDDITFTATSPIRRVEMAPHVDEVVAVKGNKAGGVAGSPSDIANKTFADPRTNTQTKKNFVTNAPVNPRPPVSASANPQEAGNRLLTGRFSEVTEMGPLGDDATARTKAGERTNGILRENMRKDPAIRKANEAVGINPDTLKAENPPGVKQFPKSGTVNLSAKDADIDANTGKVVPGPNTTAAQQRRVAQQQQQQQPAPKPVPAPVTKPNPTGGGGGSSVAPRPMMQSAGGTAGTLARGVVPGVAEAEVALIGGAYYASQSAVTAPLVTPLITAAEAVPVAGGGLVAGGVAGNLYENAATTLGASDTVAKTTGALGAVLTGAAVGAVIGSPTGIGAPVGAVIGGVAGLVGYGLSKWL
jgi:RHS repeat-associated protein